MQMSNGQHLTYCTNIHPSKGWESAWQQIQQYVPTVKTQLSPESRFGIGLCLSHRQATELLQNDNIPQFKQWLTDNGCYIFTLNGFVYQEFHSPHIKDTIHAPDWLTDERVQFSKMLVEILARLLPDDLDDGSISTSPLSYKHWQDRDMNSEDQWARYVEHLIEVIAHAIAIQDQTGKRIHLDIEAEPDGLLENTPELIRFFRDRLLPQGGKLLTERLSISQDAAQQHIRDHIGACLDTCHAAVAYESADEVLTMYDEVGLRVGKVQISSALALRLDRNTADREDQAEWLQSFAEDRFLHQVIQRNEDGTLTQYADLPAALPHIFDPEAVEWRIHFHVPIFFERYNDTITTTQNGIRETMHALRQRGLTPYMEVETYTWDVMPQDMRLPLAESIARELSWVLALP